MSPLLLVLLSAPSLAGQNSHSDGATTVVRDGSDVVSLTTDDASLEVDPGVEVAIEGDVGIAGAVLCLGAGAHIDQSAKKALTVDFKDKERSYALDGLPEESLVINLSLGWHGLCAEDGGYGMAGTLLKSEEGIAAIAVDDTLISVWRAPTEKEPTFELLGEAQFSSAELKDAVDEPLSVVIDGEKVELVDAKGTAWSTAVLSVADTSLILVAVDDGITCGANTGNEITCGANAGNGIACGANIGNGVTCGPLQEYFFDLY